VPHRKRRNEQKSSERFHLSWLDYLLLLLLQHSHKPDSKQPQQSAGIHSKQQAAGTNQLPKPSGRPAGWLAGWRVK
jgi:hypothetical protein